MPSLAEFELSTIFISPKFVSVSPFFVHDTEYAQKQGSLSHFASSIASFISCSRRSLNTRIIGFGDNTLENCAEDFLYTLHREKKDAPIEGDSELNKPRTNHFHRVLDPFILPWKPKANYLQWLSSRHSLSSPCDDATTTSFTENNE